MNFATLPRLTQTLVVINVLMFFAQFFAGDVLIANFALWPLESISPETAINVGFRPWQIITYSFLHDGVGHLFFNMLALFMFGGELEVLFGTNRFSKLYFSGVISAAICQLIFSSISGGDLRPTIGASGGVFGLLLVYGMYFPKRTILLLIPPIPLPARLFVILYGALELFLGITQTQEGVAHFAHLGGMLGTWMLIRYWRHQPPSFKRN
ncbi:MAG: rhomboid family intramembrane serine protease [Pseudomonadota bacterium]